MKRKFIYSLSHCLNILVIFSFLNCSSEPIIKSKSLVSINFEIQGNGKVKPELGTYHINSRVVFNWKIDEDDYLRLDEIYDQNQVRLGDTAYWVLDEGKLIPYNNEGNINEGILLIKVK